VAHADAASDIPTVLLALDASIVAHGPNGVRTIPANEFFVGLFTSALEPNEVLTEIRIPKQPAGWSYQKFHRRAQDWAMVGVAAVRMNGGAHVALTNMGDRPLRASAVERALDGGADPASASASAPDGTAPPSDAFGSAEYRKELSKVLVRRALEEAMG
jgi:carbon-monoxide dehydrogenase medium subunit